MKIDFPARAYNAVMAQFRRSRPLPGLNCKITQTASGFIVSPSFPPQSWNHPWTLHPRWRPLVSKQGINSGNWVVYLTPGFVNGADVVISSADAPLTSSVAPALDIKAWRDCTALGGVYPEYFIPRGAKHPPVAEPLSGASVVVPVTPKQYGTRRLLAADILLHVDHAGTTLDQYLSDPATGNLVIKSTATIQAVKRWPYRIQATAKLTGPTYPTAIDKLQGDVTEPNYDELQLGTVWMLSPSDEPDWTEPDSRWQPFVQHVTCWNLGYASVNDINFSTPTPITLHTGLAFGLLDSLGNSLLAPINDAMQSALDAVNSTSTQGYFWTL